MCDTNTVLLLRKLQRLPGSPKTAREKVLPLAYSVSRAGGARPVLSSHFLSVGNRAVSSLSSSRADGLLAACLRHMINCSLRGKGKFQTYFKRGTECAFLPEGQCGFPSRVLLFLLHSFPADVEGSSIH